MIRFASRRFSSFRPSNRLRCCSKLTPFPLSLFNSSSSPPLSIPPPRSQTILLRFLVPPAALFERDPTSNKLLWFSAPPTIVPVLPQAKHSLAYLAFLAKKKNAQPSSTQPTTEEELIPELREAFEHGVLNPGVEVLLQKRFGKGREFDGVDLEGVIRSESLFPLSWSKEEGRRGRAKLP